MRKIPERLVKVKLSDLVEDAATYCRGDVDDQKVREYYYMIRDGAEFPPISFDKRTKSLGDGWHRRRALQRHLGVDAVVEARELDFKSKRELTLWSLEQNRSHGIPLSTYDMAIAASRAMALGATTKMICDALGYSLDRFEAMLDRKLARSKEGDPVAIKTSMAHMAGKKLTKAQEDVIKGLSGLRQVRVLGEVLKLIDADLLDRANERVVVLAHSVYDKLGTWLNGKA